MDYQRLTAVLVFNLGVELGQLAVIAPRPCRPRVADRCSMDRRRLGIAASLGIAATGLCLAVARGFGR